MLSDQPRFFDHIKSATQSVRELLTAAGEEEKSMFFSDCNEVAVTLRDLRILSVLCAMIQSTRRACEKMYCGRPCRFGLHVDVVFAFDIHTHSFFPFTFLLSDSAESRSAKFTPLVVDCVTFPLLYAVRLTHKFPLSLSF